MKKGLVLKASGSSEKIKSVNASWYYTWGLGSIPGTQVPFVPMVWGRGAVPQRVSGPLLIINEPDRPDQSNMTVEEALSIWSCQKADRKGSPAVAGNALKSPWFIEFMNVAQPDFICVHWYGPPHPEALLGLVDGLYAKYSLPIWITEFAVAQWDSTKPMFTVDQVSTFMKEVIPQLESRAHVERYAWKTRDQTDPCMGTSALFRDDGSLTDLGKLYASF